MDEQELEKRKNTNALLSEKLDPHNRSVIELENMVKLTQKSLLKRLPKPFRKTCQQIFHDYIFNQKDFRLPLLTFLKMYWDSKSPSIPKPRRRQEETPKPASLHDRQIRSNARSLSKEREYISYGAEIMADMSIGKTSKCPLPRNNSAQRPKKPPKPVSATPSIPCKTPKQGYSTPKKTCSTPKHRATPQNRGYSQMRKTKANSAERVVPSRHTPDRDELLRIRQAQLASVSSS